MRTTRLSLSGLLLAASMSACALTDFEDPDYYVEALSPNFYFGLELAYQANAALIQFGTTDTPPQQPRVLRVLTWANEGGNRFDGTLGYLELDSPVERSGVLIWSANVNPPVVLGVATEFDKLVVELNPYMYAVAHQKPPIGGQYATVEVMGTGVIEFADWIDAILQLFVECRGDIGQIVPCHGLSYVIFPKLEITAFSRDIMADGRIRQYEYSISNELYIARTSIGWLYRTLQPDESKVKPIYAYLTHGPFDTPEEAARDAAERLNLRPSFLWEPVDEEQMSEEMRNSEIPRLRRALHEAINLRKR